MANKRKLIDSAELISMLPIVEKDRQISLIGAVADVVAMTSKCRVSMPWRSCVAEIAST